MAGGIADFDLTMLKPLQSSAASAAMDEKNEKRHSARAIFMTPNE
jgi:hypothetical protein